ncbi:MAG: cell division ATP-binding protein FtsE [candidate division KSB1 bacterium]|nr:cell division ATP-binding protein FtsE [candidate division KSB1 bacterium]MDZ7392336.1 cell division ATP-binding protein FtsE [candidate division KSB1 bacterium]MDZ7412520.1 cell division ATP-binding protein FtsE [candidate division KSB1 bacterium]
MIHLRNVRMVYPEGGGVECVNLDVHNGEFVFLVGPSGAGKSTVLKLIYMEERPQEGVVMVDKFDSLHMRRRDLPYLRRLLGIVFQDFRLLPDRNVFDNVAFALRVTGAGRKEIKRRVLRALAEVGLSHKRNRMPHELSGGEQQRVAIARALVNEPLAILADEPTGNLDPDTAQEVLWLLEKINLKGTAVLMATHNYALVERAGKRVVRIEGGRTL